jgi:signal transduction histidine kinase
MLPSSELLQPKLIQLCESTVHQVCELLQAQHVSLQCYRSGSWRPLADFLTDITPPDISGDLSDSVGQKLRDFSAVHFKITTKIGLVTVAGDCLLVPIFCDLTAVTQPQLWGRICVLSSPNLVQSRDIDWLMSIAKLLGQSISALYSLPQQSRFDFGAITSEQLTPSGDTDPYQQIAELIAQDRLKDEFISKISHDLRAPLMNMRMALKMFKISVSKDPVALAVLADERHSNYLHILENECEREIALINNVGNYSRSI